MWYGKTTPHLFCAAVLKVQVDHQPLKIRNCTRRTKTYGSQRTLIIFSVVICKYRVLTIFNICRTWNEIPNLWPFCLNKLSVNIIINIEYFSVEKPWPKNMPNILQKLSSCETVCFLAVSQQLETYTFRSSSSQFDLD